MMYLNQNFCQGPVIFRPLDHGPWAIYYPWYRQIGIYLSNVNFDDTI